MEENLGKKIFGGAALLGTLVYYLKDKREQIGKTVIQKMAYLLKNKGIIDFDFTLYHYGVYSPEAERELNIARDEDIVTVEWNLGSGYDIRPSGNLELFQKNYVDHDKGLKIKDVVEKFGSYGIKELVIITTAYYLMDKCNVPEEMLLDSVEKIKPNFSKEYIQSTLIKAGILNSS